ncbi:hypothetical protein Hanom_Chr01g00094461 [Helianthus anomalus]
MMICEYLRTIIFIMGNFFISPVFHLSNFPLPAAPNTVITSTNYYIRHQHNS